MKRLLFSLCLWSLPWAAWGIPFWGPEESVTNSSVWAHNGGEAAGPAGTLHMLTLDNRTGIPHLYYQRKPDGALVWSVQTVLSLASSGNVVAGHSALCTDAGQGVYAVWEEYTGGTAKLYFRRSPDDGLTWENRVLVADTGSNSVSALYPDVAVDDRGVLHLAWLQIPQVEDAGQLVYRKGSLDGLTLSAPQVLNGGQAASFKLAAGRTSLRVVYQEASGGYQQIKTKTSSDNGEHWGNAQLLNSSTTQHCRDPWIWVDAADNLYATWTQGSGASGSSVMFRYSDHQTGLVSDVEIPTVSAGTCAAPRVAVQAEKVVVAWSNNNGGNIHMRINTSANQGVDWGEDAGFSSGNQASEPALINDRGNFHLFYTYVDSRGNTAVSGQVRHALRDDTPPPAPQIASVTHPQIQGSGNNHPVFSWQAPDNPGGIGVAGYAVAFDEQPGTDPGAAAAKTATETTAEYARVPNGIHYFHVRSIDTLGNLGWVGHYAVNVDNNSFFPGDQVWVAPSPVRDGRLNLHYFLTFPADVKLEFFDAAGRKISTQSAPGIPGVAVLPMDISDWVNGTYFFRLTARSSANGQVAVVTKSFAVVK